ncbi:unnamed protein product [Moneuplotes crassus]|uniref:Uncharacterized protein n=1 Tax=Euplotes crassus TaxID=5936 RepID=A0AAD2D1A4_EUPCR|nr:unnamed protein product [Moneuplotes crassus]
MAKFLHRSLRSKTINFRVLKQYLKKVNSQRSKSTAGRKIRADYYLKLAEDIRHRSQTRKKLDCSSSLYQSLSRTKCIYPKGKLDFIRANYLEDKKLHESSHHKMYGTLNKSSDPCETKFLFNNFISEGLTNSKNQVQEEPKRLEDQEKIIQKIKKFNLNKLNLTTCNSIFKANTTLPMRPLRSKIKSITSQLYQRGRISRQLSHIRSKKGERKYRFFRLKTSHEKKPLTLSGVL